MSTQALDQPVLLPGALRSVNFFNGRLLTGDDLQREQSTHEAKLERLGREIGEGVSYGYEVEELIGTSTAAQPVVRVASGLAGSRSGVALELPAQVDISLLRTGAPTGASVEPGNLFADCQPAAASTYTAGAGVYLLVVGPASQGEGRAQVNGLSGNGAPCTTDLSIETVLFRLIRLAVAGSELGDPQLLRNRVAYGCFGAVETETVLVDPFGLPLSAWGLLDGLRASGSLSNDEVPLATIGWTIDQGIQFIDLWSVRRRMVRPPMQGGWSAFLADRRAAEAQAIFLQFQAHLAELLQGPEPTNITAAGSFERLPPAGLLPLATQGAVRPGVDLATFFTGATMRGPLFIEGAKARRLLDEALHFPPITPSSRELIWIYLVRESQDPNAWTWATPGGPYALFTTGFMRYAGSPQFDLSRWSYANFALPVD